MQSKALRPLIELTCAATGEIFLKDRREYERQVREGATRFFKDKKTASQFLHAERSAKCRITKECQYCGKPFQTTTAKKAPICCSQSCGAKQAHRTMAKDPTLIASLRQRQSEASKRHHQLVLKGERPPQRRGKRSPVDTGELLVRLPDLNRTCVICNKPFTVPKSHHHPKTCSKVCRKQLMSAVSSANPNCGGETNYKRYRYKGILMDSQWEVDIATWMDERQITWIRDRKMVFRWDDQDGKSRRYHPDFYLPKYDLYLDPKNKYLIEKDRFKIETVMKTHGIRIIWGLLEEVLKELEIAITTL